MENITEKELLELNGIKYIGLNSIILRFNSKQIKGVREQRGENKTNIFFQIQSMKKENNGCTELKIVDRFYSL